MLEKYKCILKNSTVLLAEDDQNLRVSFAKVLSLYVGRVETAEDGKEALEKYTQTHPDLIITDIKMPKLSGLEFIKHIRKENSIIPIIVTSAYSDKDFLFESIKLLLVDYLIKPIRESDLKKSLEESAKIIEDKMNKIVEIAPKILYDYNNKVVIQENHIISLTHKESDLIEILLSHKGSLVTRQNLEAKLYIYEEAPPSALKNLIFKLRKKISNNFIKTVGSLGYSI